jgi:hypothetical protein
MVTFREDLPYSVAKSKGNSQDRLLMNICEGVRDVADLDLKNILERLRAI